MLLAPVNDTKLYYVECLKGLIEGWRKQYNIPESYRWFEYLYNEMKKREQKLQQSKV